MRFETWRGMPLVFAMAAFGLALAWSGPGPGRRVSHPQHHSPRGPGLRLHDRRGDDGTADPVRPLRQGRPGRPCRPSCRLHSLLGCPGCGHDGFGHGLGHMNGCGACGGKGCGLCLGHGLAGATTAAASPAAAAASSTITRRASSPRATRAWPPWSSRRRGRLEQSGAGAGRDGLVAVALRAQRLRREGPAHASQATAAAAAAARVATTAAAPGMHARLRRPRLRDCHGLLGNGGGHGLGARLLACPPACTLARRALPPRAEGRVLRGCRRAGPPDAGLCALRRADAVARATSSPSRR